MKNEKKVPAVAVAEEGEVLDIELDETILRAHKKLASVLPLWKTC